MTTSLQIHRGVDIANLMEVLTPAIWERQNNIMPSNGGIDVLVLRAPIYPEGEECEDIWMPANAIPFVFGLMAKVRGERLGSVVISRVPPGYTILPHKDMVGMEKYYDRFHLVLQTNEKVSFLIDGENVRMSKGDVWWFDHTKLHSVSNLGDCDRIHMIVDIKLRNVS